MNEHVLQSAHSAADRVMLISASLLSIVCIAVGAAYGDLLVSLMVGVPAAVVPLLIHRLAPGALVTRLACASAFMVLAALLIQLTGGLIEAHSAQTRSDSEAAVQQAAWLLIGGIVVVCCLLCLLTSQLMKAVLRPLEKIIGVARAIAQGNLTLRIDEAPMVVQPNPFAEGETVVVPRTTADIQNAPGTGLAEVKGSANLSEVVAGLNAHVLDSDAPVFVSDMPVRFSDEGHRVAVDQQTLREKRLSLS